MRHQIRNEDIALSRVRANKINLQWTRPIARMKQENLDNIFLTDCSRRYSLAQGNEAFHMQNWDHNMCCLQILDSRYTRYFTFRISSIGLKVPTGSSKAFSSV